MYLSRLQFFFVVLRFSPEEDGHKSRADFDQLCSSLDILRRMRQKKYSKVYRVVMISAFFSFFLKLTIYREVWFSREVMDYDQEFSFSPEVTDYEQVEISLSIMGVRLNTWNLFFTRVFNTLYQNYSTCEYKSVFTGKNVEQLKKAQETKLFLRHAPFCNDGYNLWVTADYYNTI